MRSLIPLFSIIFLLISCQENAPKDKKTTSKAKIVQSQMAAAGGSTQVALGDLVPSNLVCMVNNDYMGREQIEVEVNGKTYYGCCEMCEQRLPVDGTVRIAIDPISQQEVDKADAVIAVTGERGQVSYFENKENYQKYMKTVLN